MNLVKGTTVGAGVVAGAAFTAAKYSKHLPFMNPALVATAMKVAQVSGAIALVAFAIWMVSSLVSRFWTSKPATRQTNDTTDKTSKTWNQVPDRQETVAPQDTSADLSAVPAEQPAPQPKTGTASNPDTSERRSPVPSPIPAGRTGFSNEAEMFQYGVKRNAKTLRRTLDDADQPSTGSAPLSATSKEVTAPKCEVSTPTDTPDLQRSSGGALEPSADASLQSPLASSSTVVPIVPQPEGTPSLPFSPTMTRDTALPPATALLPDTQVPAPVVLSAKTISVPEETVVQPTTTSTVSVTIVAANNPAASETLSSNSPPIPTAHTTLTSPPTEATNVDPITPPAPETPSAPSAPLPPGVSNLPLDEPKKTGTWRKKGENKSAAASSAASPTKPKTPVKTGGFDPSQITKAVLKKAVSTNQNKPEKTDDVVNPVAAAWSKLKPISSTATGSSAATTNSSPDRSRKSMTKQQWKALNRKSKS